MAAVGVLALSACGGEDHGPRTIDQTRVAALPSSRAFTGVTSAQRFGGTGGMGGPPLSAPRGAPLVWDVPAGWEELPPTKMSIANLRPAGHPDAECSLTLLGGGGGGLEANVKRWRGQLGLEPMQPRELAALPTMTLLGAPAALVEFEGVYSGMSGEPRPGWKLIGLVLARERFTVFLKMTGPVQVVDAERPAFAAFAASVRVPEVALRNGGAGPAPSNGDAEDGEGPFTYDLPEGWREAAPAQMRLVNLSAADASECYVSVLAGDGGGLLRNMNRWREQVGQGPLSARELAEMETVSLLGEDCPLLEATGEFTGMDDELRSAHTVLGTIRLTPKGTVFVKMVGPASEVAAERERFVEFVESLQERR